MTEDEVKAKLHEEVAMSSRYESAYENLLKPFFDKKQDELFQVFKDLGTSDRDGLLAVKLQSNSLQMLEDEFKHHITTGRMASKTLEELSELEKESKDE